MNELSKGTTSPTAFIYVSMENNPSANGDGYKTHYVIASILLFAMILLIAAIFFYRRAHAAAIAPGDKDFKSNSLYEGFPSFENELYQGKTPGKQIK
jgi:hypothetical protein